MTIYKVKDIVKQGTVAITASVVIDSFAGTVLNAKLEALLTLPILLVLVPCLMDMTGNVGCMIGSKIATYLHLGLVRPGIGRNPYLEKYAIAMIVVAALSSFYLTFLAMTASYFLGLEVIEPVKILVIVLVTNVSISTAAILVGIVAGFVTFRYGWDPDNTTIPIVTATCDVVGALFLILVASATGLI
ncbi:MAG: magnesium transporter [Candidatus Nezhaarchaeales archaeon]